jgi:hypothetical protein
MLMSFRTTGQDLLYTYRPLQDSRVIAIAKSEDFQEARVNMRYEADDVYSFRKEYRPAVTLVVSLLRCNARRTPRYYDAGTCI